MNLKTLSFKLAGVSAESGQFSGYAAAFGNLDRSGDIILSGAFEKDLPEFLADGIVLWNHDQKNPIGKPVKAYEDVTGLFVEAKLASTDLAQNVRTLLTEEIVKKMSIGYDVLESDSLTAENLSAYCDVSKLSIRAIERALWWGYALKRVFLYEFSPVSIPANCSADVTGVKAFEGQPLEEQFREALAAVSLCADRFKSLGDLRRAEGRAIGETNTKRIKELERALEHVREELASCLLTVLPGTSDKSAVEMANAAFFRFRENEFRVARVALGS